MQLQSFKADFKHFRCIFSIFGGGKSEQKLALELKRKIAIHPVIRWHKLFGPGAQGTLHIYMSND